MINITDFHTHAFPDALASRALASLINRSVIARPRARHDGTVAGLLGSMDAAVIARSVVCSIATAPKQFGPILKWSRSIASERIIPFASVHPMDDDIEGRVRQIKDCGIAGVKLHPQHQGFDVMDDRAQAIYAAVEDADLILVIHCGLDFAFEGDDNRAHPRKIRSVHETFPSIRLIATHMGGWRQWESALDQLAGTDVYFETSFSVGKALDALMSEFFRRHSPDRILFGSDSPWTDQRPSIAALRRVLGDDPKLLGQVLSENAQQLLDGG